MFGEDMLILAALPFVWGLGGRGSRHTCWTHVRCLAGSHGDCNDPSSYLLSWWELSLEASPLHRCYFLCEALRRKLLLTPSGSLFPDAPRSALVSESTQNTVPTGLLTQALSLHVSPFLHSWRSRSWEVFRLDVPVNVKKAMFVLLQCFPVLFSLTCHQSWLWVLLDGVLKVFISHLWPWACEFPIWVWSYLVYVYLWS